MRLSEPSDKQITEALQAIIKMGFMFYADILVNCREEQTCKQKQGPSLNL